MIEMADECDEQDPLNIGNGLVKDEDLSLFELNDNDREEAFGIFDDESESSSTSAVNDPPENDSGMIAQASIHSEPAATTSATMAGIANNGTPLATDTQQIIENAADDVGVTEAGLQSLPHSEPIASTSAAATGAGFFEGFFAVEQFPMPLMSMRHGIIKHENDDVSGGLAYKETVYCTIYFTLKSAIFTLNIYYRKKAAAMR